MYLVQLKQIKVKTTLEYLSPLSMQSNEQSESRKVKEWNTMEQKRNDTGIRHQRFFTEVKSSITYPEEL